MTYDAFNDPQHFAGIYINPGTGPVEGANAHQAGENIIAFAQECGASVLSFDGGGDDGRWTYTINRLGREHEIEMPGLPLAEVRYTGAEEQNIWHFPRLYVDGSSWVWKYAVNIVTDPGEDEDQ